MTTGTEASEGFFNTGLAEWARITVYDHGYIVRLGNKPLKDRNFFEDIDSALDYLRANLCAPVDLEPGND